MTRSLVPLLVTAVTTCSLTLLAQQSPPPTPPKPAPASAPPTTKTATPAAAPPVTALTDTGWPRQIVSNDTRILVYQPQIDEWAGYKLSGRAAVAIAPVSKPDATPTYGIVAFSADAHVDKDARLVTFEQLSVTSASFPGAPEDGKKWAATIQRSSKLKPIALERFEAAIAVWSAEHAASSIAVKNDPPRVIVAKKPSLLVIVDGEPAFREVKGTSLMRVLNTRPLVLKTKEGVFYLKVFDGWMQAPALQGPWTVTKTVTADCDVALRTAIAAKNADLLLGGDPNDPKSAPSLAKQTPQIFVETKPAELLVFEGDPEFTPIAGTKLMYADNTTGRLFVDSASQQAYLLVSGRWFAGPSSLDGPWRFVPGGSLPADFAEIPDDSAVENVKASIPGTEQAEEAIVANNIPQTAKVTRANATFAPAYDGAAKLEPIEGTTMTYVANASLPVIAVGDPVEYFGVENGVWFVSNSLTGPWLVATTIPPVIYSIPVSSPLHYVTYVRVYDSDPEHVIVGYTPGYTGAYVSGGCVVYGTGYYYPPWIGTVWYGPPVTYGFGVGIVYTPWAGWHVGFGYGWSWGAMTVAVGWGWGAYPWWGGYGWYGGYYPWAYRGGAVAWGPRGGYAAWGPGYWAGSTGNVYSRWGSTTAVTRTAGGYNAWTGNAWAGRVGSAYNSRTGVASAGQRGVVGNVYTGNYAAGSRGAAVSTRTGAAAAGRSATVGNAYTGGEATARQGVVRGADGQLEGYSSIRGNNGGLARVGNDIYAGRDGNVYRNGGSGWEQYNPGSGWSSTDRQSNLDRERSGRINGNWQSGAARSGGFHGGSRSGGGMRSGGGRRR